MAINFDALINREFAKLEELDRMAGKSDTPALDTMREAWQMGKEQRAWNERKNLQRQQIMGQLAQGTGMTFNEADLKRKKERFQNYYNKHKGSMDENTLEMGQFMLDDFDIQGQKNKDFNKLLGDGEQLKKDLMYDMENIGVDEEGNQRTLDTNDYEIITEMQKRWIDHTKEMKTNFAGRLELKPFQHINQELSNATNMNQFLLAQAREDNLIDDRELQAYQDAWSSGSYDPVAKYLNDEKAGRDAAITFNINQLGQGAQRYTELHNLFENKGVIPYTDEQGNELSISLESLEAASNKNSPNYSRTTAQFLMGLGQEYNSLEGKLKKLNKNTMDMTGSDFLANTGITFDEAEKISIEHQILGGDKTILDVPSVKRTVEPTPTGVEKTKESLGISDNDMDALGNMAKGLGAAGASYAVVKGTPKAIELTKKASEMAVKASQYVSNVTKLKPSQIAEFLDSDDLGKAVNKINRYTEEMANLSEDSPARKGLEKRINKLKDQVSSKWAKKYNVDKKAMSHLFDRKNINKWNLWKMKARAPMWLGKQFGRAGLGRIITESAGFESEGVGRTFIDLGTGYATEQAITKKFYPQLMKMLGSEKGKKYLAKKVGTVAAKKIATTAASGSAIPGWGNIAMGLIGIGLSGRDIYQLVKSYNEEEE